MDKTSETFCRRLPEPLVGTRPDRIKLIRNRIAAPSKVEFTPAIEDAEPQTSPPSAMPPCETMMTAAFIRPLAQPGIVRCAATQSSDAEIVHPTPQSPAITNNASVAVGRTSAIKT